MTGCRYAERLRPQFHFTAESGWINDPNGLVYYNGVWHMFFQHNPFIPPAPFWGHAVSRDLVHWKQVDHAILPDRMGTIFSGSAVVDRANTSGFASGKEAPLVAFYTAAGGTSDESAGVPFTQCSAFSTDAGMTWTKFEENPIIPNIKGANRDPKVIWYEPEGKWVMVLYVDDDWFALLESRDTKRWALLQDIRFPGHSECPDFFPMQVEGRPDDTKWVLTAANGDYFIGSFDGKQFICEEGPLVGDRGANYYAVQTFSDAPDDRRVQIAWMRGGEYPGMPFTQQMSFPSQMTLKAFPEGLRICRTPVLEISRLHDTEYLFENETLSSGENLLKDIEPGLLHIRADIEPGSTSSVGFTFFGETLRYCTRDSTLCCLGRTATVEQRGGRIRVEVLIDRASIEVFADDGKVVMSSCFVPETEKQPELAIFAEEGTARVRHLGISALKSAWM